MRITVFQSYKGNADQPRPRRLRSPHHEDLERRARIWTRAFRLRSHGGGILFQHPFLGVEDVVVPRQVVDVVVIYAVTEAGKVDDSLKQLVWDIVHTVKHQSEAREMPATDEDTD